MMAGVHSCSIASWPKSTKINDIVPLSGMNYCNSELQLVCC